MERKLKRSLVLKNLQCSYYSLQIYSFFIVNSHVSLSYLIEHIIFIDSLVVAVNVDSSNISGLTAQMHKLGQYNENRHINQEEMRNDADVICTQQIPSPIILPTITTHSLSQSSYLVSVFFYYDCLKDTHREATPFQSFQSLCI